VSEDLRQKVATVLHEAGDGLDRVLPGSTDRFILAIVPAFENLLATLDRFAEEPVRSQLLSAQPDRYTLAWQLLWEGCNALLAAFSLFQRGYSTECLAVARGVFERVASAIYLFDNPDLIPRFKADALPDLGTTAIGPVGRVIRDFARAYGLLSQLGSHVAKDNVGTGVLEIERGDNFTRLHLAIGGKLPTADPELAAWKDMVSEFVEIAERILATAPEQVFFNVRRVSTARSTPRGGRDVT
jgi:hypothetical protein